MVPHAPSSFCSWIHSSNYCPYVRQSFPFRHWHFGSAPIRCRAQWTCFSASIKLKKFRGMWEDFEERGTFGMPNLGISICSRKQEQCPIKYTQHHSNYFHTKLPQNRLKIRRHVSKTENCSVSSMEINSDGGWAPKARSWGHTMDRKRAQVMLVYMFVCFFSRISRNWDHLQNRKWYHMVG